MKPSSERSQLVEWAFSRIDPELERTNTAQRLTMLGICNSSEAESTVCSFMFQSFMFISRGFSSAIMCRNKQLKIWSHIVDLLSALEEEEATDKIKQKLLSSSAFTGRTVLLSSLSQY